MISPSFGFYLLATTALTAPPLIPVSLSDWEQVAGLLTAEMPLTRSQVQEKSPALLIHGITNESGRALDLTPLTWRLRDSLRDSGRINLVHPGQAALIDAEHGVQPAARVSRDDMQWYARQLGADLMLTGSLKPLTRREWQGLAEISRGQITGKLTVQLIDPVTGNDVWNTNLIVSLPAE